MQQRLYRLYTASSAGAAAACAPHARTVFARMTATAPSQVAIVSSRATAVVMTVVALDKKFRPIPAASQWILLMIALMDMPLVMMFHLASSAMHLMARM